MMKGSLKLKKTVFSGIGAGLVFVCTIIRIPLAIGYINIGDAAILILSYILGPYAFFSAAIGSLLAELINGYPVFAIPTVIIKGVMALFAGFIFSGKSGKGRKLLPKIFTVLIAEIFMAGGYFLYEMLPQIFGFDAALLELPFNLLQGLVSAILVIFITENKTVKKSKL